MEFVYRQCISDQICGLKDLFWTLNSKRLLLESRASNESLNLLIFQSMEKLQDLFADDVITIVSLSCSVWGELFILPQRLAGDLVASLSTDTIYCCHSDNSKLVLCTCCVYSKCPEAEIQKKTHIVSLRAAILWSCRLGVVTPCSILIKSHPDSRDVRCGDD